MVCAWTGLDVLAGKCRSDFAAVTDGRPNALSQPRVLTTIPRFTIRRSAEVKQGIARLCDTLSVSHDYAPCRLLSIFKGHVTLSRH